MSGWVVVIVFAATFATLNAIAALVAGDLVRLAFNGAVAIAAWGMYTTDWRRTRP